MGRVIIIADDLTGANANCALMKSIGLRAASVTCDNISDLDKKIDVYAFTTDSRAMTKEKSYKRVYERVSKLIKDDVILYSKRIDSTLRGNLAYELKAFQDALKKDNLAICVPSFPDSNRIVVNDFMYVDGIPLMNTDAGKDTKKSAISNLVSENFSKDYKGDIVHISIEEIEKGIENISKKIRENKDKDLIIFDAITNRQIENIALASVNTKIKFISVDPGPFTKEVSKVIYKKNKISTKALAIIGSVTNISIRQMQELYGKFDIFKVKVNPLKLIDIKTALEEIDKCSTIAREKLNDNNLILITTTPDKLSDRLNLKEISKDKRMSVDDISLMISRGLAKIGKLILTKDKSISGIFSSGGDVTIALTEELASQAIEIKEEIEPLVAYGRLIGGDLDGLKIISKGGMVGSEKIMVKCVDRLLSKGE